MSTDRVQQIGFAYEATPGTDPINANNAKYWLWGIETKQNLNLHPLETHVWNTIYGGDKLMPREQELLWTQVGPLNFAFVNINMIPFYLLLGKATSPATPVIIEAMAPGSSLQTFTFRTESTGGTVDKIYSAVGCKVVRVDGFYTMFRAVPTLALSIVYSGIENVTASYNDIHNGPVFPTDDGTLAGDDTVANQKYKRDSNFECSWDVGGSNDDYKDEVLTFQFSVINSAFYDLIHGRTKPVSVLEGQYIVEYGIQVLRGAKANIHTDFLAKTQHDARFKIYAGPTNYIQLDFEKVALGRENSNIKIGAEQWISDYHGTCDGFICTGVDSINQAEYYDI